MKYVATIDEASEYGITAARGAYNAQFPAQVEVMPAVPASEEVEATPAVMGPNPALLTDNTQYLDFVLASAVQSWCKQYAPVVVPDVPPTTVNGVPQSITKRQGRAQLKAEGLLAAVEAYMASLPVDDTTRMAYEDSSAWERDNPSLIGMMTMLNKTAEEADAFFVAASKL